MKPTNSENGKVPSSLKFEVEGGNREIGSWKRQAVRLSVSPMNRSREVTEGTVNNLKTTYFWKTRSKQRTTPPKRASLQTRAPCWCGLVEPPTKPSNNNKNEFINALAEKMKVFISWSGARSKKFALLLHEWVVKAVPGVEPWMSARSVEAGQSWMLELQTSIRQAEFGILCITPDNINAPWILFEAGALSEGMKDDSGSRRLVPLLFGGVAKTDLKFPLAQYQAVEADRAGFWELALVANRSLEESQRQNKTELNSTFGQLWTEFEAQLHYASLAIREESQNQPIQRPDRELLEEVLEGVRSLQTAKTNPESSSPSLAGAGGIEQSETQQLDWEDYFIRALNYANAKNLLAGLRNYAQAISILPFNISSNTKARLYSYHAALLKRLGRLDEADSELTLALKLATQSYEIEDALYNLAGVQCMKGERSKAVETIQQLLQRNSRWYNVLAHKTKYFGDILEDPRLQAAIS